jgi:hypothetical protein
MGLLYSHRGLKKYTGEMHLKEIAPTKKPWKSHTIDNSDIGAPRELCLKKCN